MKYTTKIKQAQFVGKVKLNPKGGDFSEQEKKEILEEPWGRELIRKGVLIIDGVKLSDIKEESKKKITKIDSNEQTPKEIKLDVSGAEQGGK